MARFSRTDTTPLFCFAKASQNSATKAGRPQPTRLAILISFGQFVHSVAAVSQSALPAQFLPDLARKLAGRLYGKNAHSPARKRPASKIRIGIQRSEFEPLLERLHRTLEDLRRYAAGLSLLLVFCHNLFRIFGYYFLIYSKIGGARPHPTIWWGKDPTLQSIPVRDRFLCDINSKIVFGQGKKGIIPIVFN